MKLAPIRPALRAAVDNVLEREAPPSTYAVASFLKKEPGAGVRLLGLTAIRSVFIVPTLWLGSKFIPGARVNSLAAITLGLLTSISITAGMLVVYAAKAAVVKNVQAATDVVTDRFPNG